MRDLSHLGTWNGTRFTFHQAVSLDGVTKLVTLETKDLELDDGLTVEDVIESLADPMAVTTLDGELGEVPRKSVANIANSIEDQPCEGCQHNFDLHVLATTSKDNDPMKGGIILCPDPGCDCFYTYSPTNEPINYNAEFVQKVRERVQSGEFRADND